MADDALLQRTYEARDRYVSSLGQVQPDVLAPLMNPTFMGGPSWPDLRQAWRVVRRGAHTLIISDGLSDPFSDDPKPNPGFALEVLAETPDALPERLPGTWLFELVYLVSQQCAAHGGVRELIEELGVVSLELPASDVFQAVATPHGTAGVLLGLPSADFATEFDLPGGQIRVVPAKLLWPSELNHAVSNGQAGRDDLAKRFAADGTHHRSSLSRKPVV
jgi:hypothetical protein